MTNEEEYIVDKKAVTTHLSGVSVLATPMEMNVRVITEIEEVNGKIITFKVKAYDDNNKICEGTHVRAVIETERFKAKLKAM